MKFRFEKYFILLIILLGLFLRTFNLSGSSFWLDESASIYYADLPPVQMIFCAFYNYESHPPLYYILLHFWKYFGDSEFCMRFPSVIFGVTCIYAFFLFCREFLGSRIALVGSLLLAVSFPNIYSSQEARMYILICAFTLFVAYYLYLWTESDKISYLFLYSIFMLLSLYTHLYTVFILLASNIYFFSFFKKNINRLWLWLFSQLIIISLYFPWVFAFIKTHQFFKTYESYLEVKSHVGLPAILYYFFQLFSGGLFLIKSYYLFIAIGLLALFLFLWGVMKLEFKKVVLPLLFFLTPVAGVMIINFFFPFSLFKERYLNFLIPFYLLFVTVALSGIRYRSVKYLLILFFIALNLISCFNFYFNPMYQRQDWRGVVKGIKKYHKAGDVVLVRPWLAKKVVDYYAGGALPVLGIYGVRPDHLKKDLGPYRRLWFITIPALFSPEDDEARNFLCGNYQLVASDYTSNFYSINVLGVSLYRLKNF